MFLVWNMNIEFNVITERRKYQPIPNTEMAEFEKCV